MQLHVYRIKACIQFCFYNVLILYSRSVHVSAYVLTPTAAGSTGNINEVKIADRWDGAMPCTERKHCSSEVAFGDL